MQAKKNIVSFGFIRLDGRKKLPLFRQLYNELRTAILDGRLAASTRLPSSRDLGDQLNVSRTTVVSAIDRLIGEGYLVAEVGRGTFVSKDIPSEHPFIHTSPPRSSTTASRKKTPSLPQFSQRGEQYNTVTANSLDASIVKPFQPGVPALDKFPMAVWAKVVRRVWSNISARQLTYGEPAGYFRLRQSIAEYLRAHRGVRCQTEQVIVVSGTQQAIEVISRLTIDEGDTVLFENPGYVNSREIIARNGGRIVPMQVDENGVNVTDAIRRHPSAKLAYVTPSHQYPIGITMPIERRMELIQWAGRTGGLLVEDDYDSEYRYAQSPIPSMQGLDSSERTIYIGSFSKVIFPALSMGYIVVPSRMVVAFEHALSLAARPPSHVDQLILNEFIRAGHFGRHLRRMRKTHADRHHAFTEALGKHLPGKLKLPGSQAGLHCAAILAGKKSDRQISERLDKIGIVARPLSHYYSKKTKAANRLNGLVFGFACATPTQLRQAVQKSAPIIGW